MDDSISAEWRRAFAVGALLFSAATVWWLLIYGRPENLLHQSAMSWCFAIFAGVLVGLGFGAVVQFLPWVKKG